MARHAHDHAHDDRRRLLWALLLTGGFMVAEVVGGLLAGSLALLADAGHMLTDTAALALAWHALHAAARPATHRHSYGHGRQEVLAALINAGALLAIAAWITVEAIGRLLEPVAVLGGPMLAVALAGLAVNLVVFRILHGSSGESLNIEGATLHVLGDLLGSLAAIAAAAVILLTGWTPIDPLLSVLVALLILRSAWGLAARSWHVLMEGTPEDLDIPSLRAALIEAVPGVVDVHHVHAWSLKPGHRLVTLHAIVAEGCSDTVALRELHRVLSERFRLDHATVQLERGRCIEDSAGA